MPSLKARIGCAIAELITSHRLQGARRAMFAAVRKITVRTATVHYFHQHDDPYSQLLASYLPILQSRYRITVIAHAVPAPDAAAAPDLQRLGQWSARDAARLRQSLQAWTAEPPAVLPLPGLTPDALQRGAALRKKKGHYLGAMLYFEGEWYWGTDRLHYLEQRLEEAGLASCSSTPLIPAHSLQFQAIHSKPVNPPVIHFYCSLRSPYTYLAARQVRQLAQHYGAELRIRFVLPMVMRGLPVPLSKREAMRMGFAFGRVVDPVGKPVESGLALLHAACSRGLGSAFLESFLSAVFAEGVDAGSREGLLLIAQRAGFSTSEIQAALEDESWRDVAEVNRADLLERGLWGVPSYRVNEQPVLWGQDRLWMLEEDLLRELAEHPLHHTSTHQTPVRV